MIPPMTFHSPLISPLAPSNIISPPAISGIRIRCCCASIKPNTLRDDVCLITLPEDTTVAGLFTRSKTSSAPVLLCRRNLVYGRARALVINSGNANAFSGIAGVDAVEAVIHSVAKRVACSPDEVFTASTGVIGLPLPRERIVEALTKLTSSNHPDTDWQSAARAIMTTDSFPKLSHRVLNLPSGAQITLTGIAKGSGMIGPDMATLLAFVFCTARLPHEMLQHALRQAVECSFNSITVDGDTSTSDTILGFASGEHEIDIGSDMPAFIEKLSDLCLDIAHQVVCDGEGAKKLISITVSGAETTAAAKIIGLSIGNSPLVKTAIAGEDANWGRIVMAVGKAGQAADRDRLAIIIGGISVAKNGQVDPNYQEGDLDLHMKGGKIDIKVDVGVGNSSSTIWTCDLTHGYIDINANYRS